MERNRRAVRVLVLLACTAWTPNRVERGPEIGRKWVAVVAPVVTVVAVGAVAIASQLGSSHDEPSRPRPPLKAEGAESGLPVGPPPESTSTTVPPMPAPTTSATTSPGSPATTVGPTRAQVVPTTGSASTPGPLPPGFESSVKEIDAATAARLTASWRPGCPVPLRDLRLVTITHWGFDGQPRPGELVVHAAHAEGIQRVFGELFAAAFPIDQVRLVDEFGGDDDRSMAANNTSAFNCRRVRGSTRWSQHAYGRALDINPVQNPYVTPDGAVLPPAGREFLRRDASRQGLVVARGPVVAAFGRIGWRWGGAWSNPDYQHFSANGR
ncbi:MAG: M15 family metallopeptidase [Actinomycetota bacterium]